MNIQDAIKILASDDEETYSLLCTVNSVDTTNNVCVVTPINGDPQLFDVKFSPDNTNTGFVVIPMVNSIVMVTFLSKENAFISMFSQVQSYSLKTSTDDLNQLLKDLITQISNVATACSEITVIASSFGANTTQPANLVSFTTAVTELTTISGRLANLFI